MAILCDFWCELSTSIETITLMKNPISLGNYFQIKLSIRDLIAAFMLSFLSLNVLCQSALQFNGSNSIVSSSTSIGLDNISDAGFTMEAWVWSFDLTGLNSIIRKSGDYSFYINNGQLVADVYDDFTTDVNVVSGPTGLPLLTWIHVAFTWDGSTGLFYLNGVQSVGTTITGTSVAVEDLSIGCGQIPATGPWEGNIDEVRIWTCVKSQAEIMADMSAMHTGAEPGLALYYDFEDGAGATLTDLSPNGNDGTLANGPAWVAGVATAGAPTFGGCAIPSDNHYWVGGPGNWSDAANHWANTSGGVPGSAGVPASGDNAIFDINSGLGAADVVNIDVAPVIDTLDYSGVPNSFVFNNAGFDMTLEHSWIGSASGVTFTGTWGEIIFNASTPNESITSGGTTFLQDFRVSGAEVLELVDNLDLTTGSMFVDNGGLILNGNALFCSTFESNTTNTRTIDISNSTINLALGSWVVDGTGLTFNGASSLINMNDNAGTATFEGGSVTYDTIRSLTATTFNYTDNNSMTWIELVTSSQLNINNGNTLSTDTLIINGTCLAPATITVPGPGANGNINLTGTSDLDLTGIEVINVDAIAPGNYILRLSDTTNAAGWTNGETNFYWVNDGGNWNDGSQWALTTGGPGSGCIPGAADSVFFDANSFSAPGFTVVVDDTAYAGYVDWTAVTNNQTFRLDSSIYVYGDVLLDAGMTVNRGGLISSAIVFKENGALTSNGVVLDCNINIVMDDATNAFELSDDLVTTDSASITQLNGLFVTNNNGLTTGSYVTANNPGTGADIREIQLGSSSVTILKEFFAFADTSLIINPGTSNLYIGDNQGFVNKLVTEGTKNFYNVTLNFSPNSIAQTVEGSNTFNKLIIEPGSEVYFESGETQTVTDSLIAQGTCNDSILIHTLDTTGLSVALLNKTGTDYVAECLNIIGIENSGDQLTTLFSSDLGSNVNWDFDTAPAVNPSFQPDSTLSSFCFGDTVHFTNNSTPFNGTISDLTFEWSVADGSLPILETTSTVEANRLGAQFNYAQNAGTSSDALSQINGWTETADPQNIFNPVSGELTTTPGNENMSYTFTVGYRFSLVNGTGSEVYLVDMDSDPDTVQYNYLPELKIFKNGSQFGVGSSQFAFPTHTFLEDTLLNGVTQIGADTVTLTLTAQGLTPTDVLTAQIGADVSFAGFTTEPRWKDGTLPAANDVTVSYRIDIDTIFMQAIPTTPAYNTTNFVHEFESSGDSISVILNAIDTRNFCEAQDTFYVDIIEPTPSLLASDTDPIVCPNSTIEFEAFSPDSLTLFEFLYNGVSQNTPSLNDTLLTIYPVQADDTIALVGFERGCSSDTSAFFTYDLFPASVSTWSNNSAGEVICESDTVIFTSSSPDSINTFQYLINNVSVSGILDSLATYTTSTLNDADLVSLITIDTNSCRDTTSLTFTVNPLPTTSLAESNGGNVICENDAITFTGSGSDLYSFFLNDTLVQGPLATTTWLTDSLAVGDTVSLIGTSSAGCVLEAPEEYTYIVNPAPVMSLTSSDADNIICTGETVTFTANGAVGYEFFVNGVSQGPLSTVNTFVSSTLNNGDVVTVDGNIAGCTGNIPSITMTVNTAPTTNLVNSDDGDNVICQGTLVDFTASGATNYQFFVNGNSQGASSTTNTFSTNTLQNGDVVQVVGESNGCQVSASDAFVVLSVPNVTMISSDPNNEICDGESITFTGSNAQNYEFFVNNTSVQGPINNSIFTTSTFTTGANDVFVIGTANNGCTDTSQVIQVDVNPIPVITVSSSDPDNIICEGETVVFTAAGGDNYQFLINGTPQTSLTPTNTFSTSNLLDGQTLVVDGELNGCSDSSTGITFTVNPSPNVVLTSSDANNIFCENEVVTFSSSGAANYEFFVDGISQGPLSPVNSINSSGFAIGTYTVSVEGEASNCTASSSVNVTVNGIPNITLNSSDSDNSICDGESVVYTATGGVLYEFFINGVSQGAADPDNTFMVNSLNDNDIVSVEGASAAGCLNDEQFTPIEVLPIPVVTLLSSDPDQQICTGESVTFTASGAAEYEFFINGVSQGAPSPVDNITTTNLSFNDVITVEGTSLGCAGISNSIQFEVYSFPIVDLINNQDTVLCDDELTDLVATGADEYLYYINGVPQGTFSLVNDFQSLLNNGDVVTVEGQTNGCASLSSSSFTFAVFNYPTITSVASDPDLEICLFDTVEFTSTGATEYVYEINNLQIGANSSGIFETDEIADGDVFSVIGFNAHCASAPIDFTFIVNEMNLGWTVSPSTMICEGDQVDFTATGADEYEFFLNGASQGAPSATNTYSSSSIEHNDEVTFIGYNNTTGCNQPFDDFSIISVLDAPVITPLSSTTFCEGDSVILVSNAPYGNEWYLNSSLLPGETDTFHVADSSGSYTLQVTLGGDGDLWSQGMNATGVFADGTAFNSDVPMASTSGINFTELSAGFNFVMGIDENNQLFAWGDNATGQLGNGTFTASLSPIAVAGLTDVKTVATASNSTMATLNSGEVYVWGNNIEGQLGTGNNSVINFPFLNTNLSDVDTIAAGRFHFVILNNDGTVETVGNNDYGQLGDNTLLNSSLPVSLTLTDIVSVGAGEYTSYAVDNNGVLYVWGNNAQGQLGLGDQTSRLVPTSANIPNVVSAQGGANHSVFLTNENEVYTAGGNSYGQLGVGNQTNSTIPKKVDLQGVDMIAAGQYTTLMKRTDNSVFAAGNNTENQISSITDTTIVTPLHMSSLDGVTFVESSQNASHFLFGKQVTCESAPVVTDFLPSPSVVIFANGDTLSTNQPGAASYQWYFNGNPVAGGSNATLVATSSGTYMVEVNYANGCTSSSDDYVHSIANTGVEQILSFNLYPNPAKDIVNLEWSAEIGSMNITLIDNVGKVIETFSSKGMNITIPCDQLDNGVYYLKVESVEARKTFKFVVNH